MKKITKTWTTVATVGYTSSVSRNENRSAHGAVCHLQVRQGVSGLLGRKVNANGRYTEAGEAFRLDTETLEHWQSIHRATR
jgi:hypothetical protein